MSVVLPTTSPSKVSLERKPVRWGEQQRLEFIDFRLLWDGRINRGELVDFFGISIQQASLDLASYIKLAPSNLEYDRRDKVYRVTKSFAPIITPLNTQSFLTQILASSLGWEASGSSFIGWQPPVDIVQFPARTIKADILIGVLWAIRDGLEIEIAYQSMRSPLPERRWIRPHSIAYDGTRWHTRAWCAKNLDFRDFVFARIQQFYESRNAPALGIEDMRWNSYVTVILRPRNGLSASQRAAVEADFGMTEGELKISVRESQVGYFIRQLQMESRTSLVRGQPIELANEAELSHLLDLVRK
jgi:hypothetical protein